MVASTFTAGGEAETCFLSNAETADRRGERDSPKKLADLAGVSFGSEP